MDYLVGFGHVVAAGLFRQGGCCLGGIRIYRAGRAQAIAEGRDGADSDGGA